MVKALEVDSFDFFVLRRIIAIKKRFCKSFYFYKNLVCETKFLREPCAGLIENGINRLIRWTCESRVDRVGISICGFFLLGLPGETPAESQATIDFANKLNPLWAQFTVTVPYPGTKMFEDLDQKGKIRTYNWKKYNTWSGWQGSEDIPFVPDGRTVEELRNLQKSALRKFYLRPVVVLQFLKHMHSWKDFQKYLIGVMVLLKSKFR